MSTLTVNNTALTIKEYKGQRVVTFKDIDAVHGRPEGTARKRFNDNKIHLTDGVDYFYIQTSEIRTFGIDSPRGGYVLTESGYLLSSEKRTKEILKKIRKGY